MSNCQMPSYRTFLFSDAFYSLSEALFLYSTLKQLHSIRCFTNERIHLYVCECGMYTYVYVFICNCVCLYALGIFYRKTTDRCHLTFPTIKHIYVRASVYVRVNAFEPVLACICVFTFTINRIYAKITLSFPLCHFPAFHNFMPPFSVELPCTVCLLSTCISR